MKKNRKYVIRGLFALLAVAALYFLFAGGNGKKDELKLVEASRGTVVEKAMAVGTIEPEKEVRVKSAIPGIVSQVLFRVGDRVKRGQPLLTVLPNPTPLDYAESRRQMELAEVTMQKLRSEWERNVKLFRDNLISASVMEGVESQYREAALRHRMSSEKFELLQKGNATVAGQKVDSVVRSPIDGVVLSQSVFEGDPVVPLTNYQPGTDLCALADMGRILFKGTVDEIDVGKLQPQMAVEIQIGALPQARVSGRLERIYPKARKEGNATLFDVEIVVLPAEGVTLRAGYSATAMVKIREARDVLTVPERLVTFENGKRWVEVKRGEKVERCEIETGLSDGLVMEVRRGLTAGAQVVERPPREIQ